jgi:16S rRNA (cytidine1402-2'-O)-methyltransferase
MQYEIESGELKLEAIPGPSALTAALSIAGVACANFTFLGFLPHKKGRETLFKEIISSERTMVFYESPHRIVKTLESLVEHTSNIQHTENSFGQDITKTSGHTSHKNKSIASLPKKVTICRELTKIFEEVVVGSPEEVRDYFIKNDDKVRGEFVVIVS